MNDGKSRKQSTGKGSLGHVESTRSVIYGAGTPLSWSLVWGNGTRVPGVVVHGCNSSTWKLKQMDYFEFEAKLGYKVSARPARTTELSQKQNKTSKLDVGSEDPGVEGIK